MSDINHIQQVWQEADCLYSDQQVQQALDEIGNKMTEVLQNTNPLLLCVMTGGIIPTGHIITRLQFPLELDYIHATRYQGETSGGKLEWLVEPRIDLQGRVVVIVDDILDEGITLDALIQYCQAHGAERVYSVVLIEKKRHRSKEVHADFVALTTEDRYLFGYGMDYKGYLRNAAGIYAVKGM
ncbi:MAG: hypoxanthine-guanine phosphoribosyltransferase [Gammaproteobacteria bacterium]|nr:hypoxanthine-guanine phosphoribosyltransferase [Gammaproteobacteria bacterium]MDH5778351.1 hypoxanthine-guanine phosphoribosyltransferase [Gammaproteobacteria bacterium]